jgi:hypothetical protein
MARPAIIGKPRYPPRRLGRVQGDEHEPHAYEGEREASPVDVR